MSFTAPGTEPWWPGKKEKGEVDYSLPPTSPVTLTPPPEITAPKIPSLTEQMAALSPEWQGFLGAPITAPTLQPIDFSKLPPITSYVPQIGEAGAKQLELGLKALQETFGPQAEATGELISARGLTGSGVEAETMRRLYGEQARTTERYTSETNLGILREQIAEMQRVSGLTENRAMNILGLNNQRDLTNLQAELQTQGMNFDTAATMLNEQSQISIAQGNLDLGASQSNAANALTYLGTQIQARELELENWVSGREDYWNEIKYELDLNDQERQWFEISTRNAAAAAQVILASKLSQDEKERLINQVYENYGLSRYSPYDEEEEVAVAGVQSEVPQEGDYRKNPETNLVEVYRNGQWKEIPSQY